jgi:hypothetical protein
MLIVREKGTEKTCDLTFFLQVYTFFGVINGASEQLRVWVDNIMLVDLWCSLTGTEASGSIYFPSTSSYFSILAEYKQGSVDSISSARLLWTASDFGKEVIPITQFYQSNLFFSNQIDIIPSNACAGMSTVEGIGLSVATAGLTSVFRVQVKDAFGNLRMCGMDQVSLDSSIWLSEIHSFCVDTAYAMEYVASGLARSDYILHIRIKETDVCGSPNILRVEAGLVDAWSSSLQGESVSVATSGLLASFAILAKDRFGSLVSASDSRFAVYATGAGLYKTYPTQELSVFQTQFQITCSSLYRFSLLTPKFSGLSLRHCSTVQCTLAEQLLDSVSYEDPSFWGSPSQRIDGTSSFLVQWDGLIWPPLSQSFTLTAQIADVSDRIQLWIDQACLIDQWNSIVSTVLVVPFNFKTLGGYNISLKYMHLSNQAGLKLLWSSASPLLFDQRPIERNYFSELPKPSDGRNFDVAVVPGNRFVFTIINPDFSIATVGRQVTFSILVRDVWGNIIDNHADLIAYLNPVDSIARSVHAFVSPGSAGLYDARLAMPIVAGKYVVHIAKPFKGLTASYYIDSELSVPTSSRQSYDVDFSSAGVSSSFSSLPAGQLFGIRWMGFICPQASLTHTFFITVLTESERVQLWLDNSIIVDQWSSISQTKLSGTIWLGAAHSYYSLRLDYKQTNATFASGVALSWASASSILVGIIPSDRLYTNSPSPSASDVIQVLVHAGTFCASKSTHSFSVSGSQTAPYVTTFSISVRDWYGNFLDESTAFVPIHVQSVSLDGKSVSIGSLGEFNSVLSTVNANLKITVAGLYRIMIAGLSETGLVGAYFGDSECRRIEAAQVVKTINFTWDSEVFVGRRPSKISCLRWTGFLYVSISDNYTFIFDAVDEMSLFLKDLFVGHYKPGESMEQISSGHTSPLYLNRGAVPIKAICRNLTGIQQCSLLWRAGMWDRASDLSKHFYSDLVLIGNVQSPPYLRVNAGPCFAPLSLALGSGLSQAFAGYAISFTIRCKDSFGNPSSGDTTDFYIFGTANSFRKRAIRFSNSLSNLENGDFQVSFLLNTQVPCQCRHFQPDSFSCAAFSFLFELVY